VGGGNALDLSVDAKQESQIEPTPVKDAVEKGPFLGKTISKPGS